MAKRPSRQVAVRFTLVALGAATSTLWQVPAHAQAATARSIYDAYAPQVSVNAGQSLLLPLAGKANRIAVANENVVDYRQTGADQLYLIGRQVGKTDLTIWYASGYVQSFKVENTLDPIPLRKLIDAVTSESANIQILVSGSSFVLQGVVADVPTVDAVLTVAQAYAGSLSRQLSKLGEDSAEKNAGGGESGKGDKAAPLVVMINQTGDPGSSRTIAGANTVGVINALAVRDDQQVMLEVRIAEVARSLAQRMGVSVGANNASGSWSWRVGSAFLGNGAGTGSLSFFGNGPNFTIDLDAERKAGRVKILAEPTIATMSGTEGSFLVGGSVFIPTPTTSGSNNNNSNVTLEEREFGVALKFKPTVLAERNINLEMSSEVSDISREGISYQTGAAAAILPTLTKSKFATTVQLREGQSLIIGGLLKNNLTETKKFLPVLGQIPMLGALFRSKDYASDQSELIVVVRPMFARATDVAPALPTDVAPAPQAEPASGGAPAASQSASESGPRHAELPAIDGTVTDSP